MTLGLNTSDKSLGIISKVDIEYYKKDTSHIKYEVIHTKIEIYTNTHKITLDLNGKLEDVDIIKL